MQVDELLAFVRGSSRCPAQAAARRPGGTARRPGAHRAGLPLPRPVDVHPVRRGVAAGADGPAPRLEPDRHHLRVRRADRRACTPTTCSGSTSCCCGCATRATRCSSSSTSRRSSRSPTTSSTWVPGPATPAGEVVYEGTVDGLRASGTLTGRHLDRVHEPRTRRPGPRQGALRIEHATLHNLQDVTVDIPRGVLTVVTGVAGSGKSSLVLGVLPAAAPGRRRRRPEADPRLDPVQHRHVDRDARHDPQVVRQGERGQARAVQRQLRGRLPRVQGARADLHRPGLPRHRRQRLRGLRGEAVHRGGARLPAAREGHQRGAGHDRRRGPRAS